MSKRGIVLLILSLLLTGCGIQDKNKIIKIYKENERLFVEAVKTKDFKKLKAVFGVKKIYESNNSVSIDFGGNGIGGNSNYYEIQYHYVECCNEFKLNDNFKKYDNGFLYNEKEYDKGGDNIFYVEDLGNGYYYVEMHF